MIRMYPLYLLRLTSISCAGDVFITATTMYLYSNHIIMRAHTTTLSRHLNPGQAEKILGYVVTVRSFNFKNMLCVYWIPRIRPEGLEGAFGSISFLPPLLGFISGMRIILPATKRNDAQRNRERW